MKITKATINRLRNWNHDRFLRASYILQDIAERHIFYDETRVVDAGERGVFVVSLETDKPVFLGLAACFPKLVNAPFTLGLNHVNILDINELTKAMLAEMS